MTTWELVRLMEPCCYITFIGIRILILLGILMTGKLIFSLFWQGDDERIKP